ncbi:GntR family transcriptional regulator [Paenibacillus flagellatus]|uniref:GntR family transcriptional regulator n=1 Tax=Paenibacillus flagellatus TaxID=2211139 RepID=A0A2V5KUH1_9BACL|nr:GntR family transcriptional regulator [Paenibacillus flagellatus]PYI55567.1 GntR family transcriptional regulator [Paenibacillus flagellatus]
MDKQETKRVPLYSQIRAYIVERIRLNEWSADDQLPTEAALAEQFDVSRFTIKKALSALVEEGLVYRVQGKGTFIAPAAAPSDLPHVEEPPGVPTVFRPVAFIVPSIQSPLASRILAGAEDVLSERGYHVLYRSTLNDAERERDILRDCLRLGVKGILIFPADGETYNEELLRLSFNRFPVVVIDRYLRGVETNCVCSDHVGGAYDAVTKLVELGHTNIGFVSVLNKRVTSLEDRLTGYERALAHHGIPVDYRRCLFETGEARREEGEDTDPRVLLRSYLSRNPELTAVFAATVSSGLALVAAAEDLGIQVPGELSVLFFDDYEYAELSRIPPSCVVQDERTIGAEAAKLLLSIIDNPSQERRRILVPTRLVLRQSAVARSDGERLTRNRNGSIGTVT